MHFTNIARKYENQGLNENYISVYVHSILLNEFFFILPCSS